MGRGGARSLLCEFGRVAVLLLVDNISGLSRAQRRIAQWIDWNPDQPGIALLDVHIPDRHRIRRLDALIWSAQRCVAVTATGFRSRQNGTLVVPPTGPLRMSNGRKADISGNTLLSDPVTRARVNSAATKTWLERATGTRCVLYELLLITAVRGQIITAIDAPDLPPRTDILVEDFDLFRHYFHRFAELSPRWTSARIAKVIDSLGLSYLYDGDEDLLAEAMGETKSSARIFSFPH